MKPCASATTRYYPSGTIQVEETALGYAVPVRGVRVKARRWFKMGSALTDSSGGFYIGTGFRDKARMFVQFKRGLATTRGFINSFKLWKPCCRLRPDWGCIARALYKTYTFSYQRNEHSVGARSWVAASLFNTLANAQTFAAARGIPGPPADLNIWLLPDPAKGPAPMLRYIASTCIVSQMIDYLLIGSGLGDIALVKQILQRQLPDVTIDYFSDAPGTLESYELGARSCSMS